MRKLILAFLVGVTVAACCSAGLADDAQWCADGTNVLVVYLSDGPDRPAGGKSGSQQVAEYYAQRRGVPAENMLGLVLKDKAKADPMLYHDFFELILKPVADKLASKSASGVTFADKVCYIVLCPEIPLRVNTAQPVAKDEKDHFRNTVTRSLDGFLINIAANLHAGVNAQTGGPGSGSSGMLGGIPQELTLPIYGQYAQPQPRHFLQLRKESPLEYNFYLVNRLGVDLKSAVDMIDGGLYAERFLRLPGPEEETDYRPAMWFDQRYDFQAPDHVFALSRAVAMAQGVRGSPFGEGKGLLQVWPLVIDNQHEEIGLMVFGKQHKPCVTSRILDVDDTGLTLWYPGMIATPGKPTADIPGALYFPPGCHVSYVPPVSASGAASAPASAGTATSEPAVTAKVVRIDGDHNRLLLDSTKDFVKGGTVRYEWPGEFPADNCFFFNGFYGLAQFEDVFKFPPGAIGIHVDSACLVWAEGAMHRGIAATFGVVTEPLSIGIPHGQLVLLALARGCDWAEACYNGLELAQRWTGLVFGDPLYAPFRSREIVAKAPPVIGPVTVKTFSNAAIVTASLAGKSDDELADVALFRLEYGPTTQYGQAVDFFDWPEPEKSKLEKNKDGSDRRRFGYSRHFVAQLKGLVAGREYHYRLIARNPAGLETATTDATFKP